MRGLDDQRVTIRPIITAAREQPHALAFTLQNQAIPIVLDLMKPIRAGWDFGTARWDAGLVAKFTQHAA